MGTCWTPIDVEHGAGPNAYALAKMRFATRTPFYLMFCDGPDPSTAHCRYSIEEDNELDTDVGWVRVRKAWDGAGDEHRRIYELATQYAGVPDKAVAPFWTQYGASNELLSSEVEKATDDRPALYVVGPSWMPVDPVHAGAIVARPVSALDLAQLPDTSHSLWDWAGGNESCPLGELPVPGRQLNACHDFATAMGAVNANHFLPLSRRHWRHYHGLALKQAERCRNMAERIGTLVTKEFDLVTWEEAPRDVTTLETEVHECERVAMLWEGVAQHYLHDAWSTGHMFRRWGYTDLADFPHVFSGDTFGLLASLKPEDVAARKLLIANITAVYSGTIHGAKGILDELLGASKRNNDPLCSPTWEEWELNPTDIVNPYTVFTRPTQWKDERVFGGDEVGIGGAGSGDGMLGSAGGADDSGEDLPVYQGGGDLFLREILAPTPNGAPDGHGMAEQRSRLLGCSTGSAREVYAALPQWTGEMGPLSLPEDVELFDPNSGLCWEHWATNESINAAHSITFQGIDLGPLNLNFQQPIGRLSHTTINAIVVGVGNRALVYNGPDGTPALLLKAAFDVQRNMERISLFYAAEAKKDKASGQARINAARQDRLSFLGVKPAVDDLAPDAPASSYADQPGSGRPQDAIVPRMFPRAFLAETCETGRSVAELKQRCQTPVNGEADAAACTMCTQIVRSWMQGCPRIVGGREPSLCDALEVSASHRPQLPFPEQILQDSGDPLSDPEDECPYWTKEQLAIEYCIGYSDEHRSYCDAQLPTLDVKSEVPGYSYVSWLNEVMVERNSCGSLPDQSTDWDLRLEADEASLGRPYWASIDPPVMIGGNRRSTQFQRNSRGAGQARACGAVQNAVTARGSCAALYSGAGLSLPAGFVPVAPDSTDYSIFSDGSQDLFEVMSQFPDHVRWKEREPFCSARLPVDPLPVVCPEGLACGADGFCRDAEPFLSVLQR